MINVSRQDKNYFENFKQFAKNQLRRQVIHCYCLFITEMQINLKKEKKDIVVKIFYFYLKVF